MDCMSFSWYKSGKQSGQLCIFVLVGHESAKFYINFILNWAYNKIGLIIKLAYNKIGLQQNWLIIKGVILFKHLQQSVFRLPSKQLSTDMQQIDLDINEDAIEGTIDICVQLGYLKNLTENKLGPVQLSISIVCQEVNFAIPYQVISKKTYKSDSKINLQAYNSPFYILHPYENSIIDEIVIFKIHVPIDQVQTQKMKIYIGLQTINELAYQEQQSIKRLGEVQISFNSIMYIDSFLPCLFSVYGVSVEAHVYTHLLTCKYGNLNNVYRHHFYQTIDHLVISYNKLRQKVNSLVKNEASLILEEDLLPMFINMKNYPEYTHIRAFIEKRIFQQQTMKDHKQVLKKFVQKFIPFMTQKLLMLWKSFLKGVNFSLVNLSKTLFYQKLGLQFKKRVQFKVQSTRLSKQQMKNKRLFDNSTSQNSNGGSLTRSQVNQRCSFIENGLVPENDLKQRFNDKNLYDSFKKMCISNLEIDYPSVKIRMNKSIKIDQKYGIQMMSEPHLIVLVHGLGATSNAFQLFKANINNIYSNNIYVLNSVCNQNSINQEIEQMGRKLSVQVFQFINKKNFGQKFQLSFIGHSLGGLIIRSALPSLHMFKFNMKTLITMSTPHLGYFYHNSPLNKAGMWAISKFSDNQIIDNLLMSDSKNPNLNQQSAYRNSYLFNLSETQGMGWFEHIMFCGASDDYFVSPMSALITTKQNIQAKRDIKSKLWQQMRSNIDVQINDSNIYKLLVEFNDTSQISLKDTILGRKAHIMYLSSQDFITYLLLVYKQFFI